MDEHNLLGIIGRFWEARVAGDKAAVASFLAPDATYELVGASAFADPIAVGPSAVAATAVDKLIDQFRFHSVQPLVTVVDGRKAAVVSKLEVSYCGGSPETSEICDLWEFDANDKVRSLRQFVDTHLVYRMMNRAV